MNTGGQSFLRKAMRLLGAGMPMTLHSDEIFAIRPGASIPALMAYGPMGGSSREEDKKPYRMLDGGIAEIAICGVLSKHPSFFRIFGCSDKPTLGELTEAVHQAAADESVAGIMLYVESPGGTLGGTPELSDAVAKARTTKPVHAFAQDECCSAAYWPACQADRLTASRAAGVGGIGVYSILLDASKAAGMEGLKFHVISSGTYKGAGAEPGAGLTPEQLEYFQSRIDDTAELFVADVASGRRLAASKVRELADGRCHIAADAASLGLTDGVSTYAEALEALAAAIQTPAQPRPAAPPPPPEPELEPEDEELPPEESGDNEENAMSNTPKPAANAGTEEEMGLLAKLREMFGGSAKEATPPVAAATPPAAPAVTDEDIDRRVQAAIDARLHAQEVDADLRALADKVPPAVLNDPETRSMLLEAKAKNPESYQKRLALVAGNDASHLLGGWVADERTAGEASVKGGEAEMLARNGIDEKRNAELKRRYGLNSGPVN